MMQHEYTGELQTSETTPTQNQLSPLNNTGLFFQGLHYSDSSRDVVGNETRRIGNYNRTSI